MTFEEFVRDLKEKLPVGMILKNPERGTSTILPYRNGNIRYQRGESPTSLSLRDMFDAYIKFKGKKCTSKDLKVFRPKIFSGNQRRGGNCSFFFMVLHEMDLCSEIRRESHGSSPFCAEIR
jgi:hypothetical protein